MNRPIHADDLVALVGDEKQLGIVERTHADVDTHESHPTRGESDPVSRDQSISQNVFDKFLKDGVPPPGCVYVRWHRTPLATLIPESRLTLLDRSLLIGDVVKRSARDAMSGVVINSSTLCSLQPMSEFKVSGHPNKRLKGLMHWESEDVGIQGVPSGRPAPLVDIPSSELKSGEHLNEEDLVVWKDRLGRIEQIKTNVVVRLTDNSVVEVREDLVEHMDDSPELCATGDIVTAKKGALRTGKWVYGQYNANTPPIGTVVARTVVEAEMSWLQRRIGAPNTDDPPESLERPELEADDFRVYDRARLPRRNPSSQPSATVSYSEFDVGRLGVRVRFKDLAGACVKYDGSTHHGKLPKIDRQDTLGYDINVFDVVNFRTDVTVQWQDQSITHHPSIDLEPDSSIDDDHAAWPGEIAHTLDFSDVFGFKGYTQAGKVGVVQTVNSTERMATLKWCPDGQVQYFEDIEENPGVKTVILGIVGRAAGEQEELSLYDLNTPALLNVRRGDIVLIINQNRADDGSSRLNGQLDWVGEIVDTCLDGSLTVRLGAMDEVRDVQISREYVQVAVRSDGTDQLDAWDNGWDEEEDWPVEYDSDGNEVSGYDSEDMSDAEEEDAAPIRYEDENGIPLDEDDVENEEWESDDSADDVEMADAPPPPTPPKSHSITPPEVGKPDVQGVDTADTQHASGGPEQYVVLEGPVPTNHHYRDKAATENNTHMKRVQKEHKILRSANALPQGVYVRTWESRMDLLRVLIIGPVDTPYADAPFIFDFYLSSTFPAEPPQAYFHSWLAESGLGGAGRVNPNLYEDGKICLSLLGTWDGAKNEGWAAARSTLLQVIVSILGLVLVREPYFNEAGYEPLARLESSKRPSALYNEHTLLRAHSFVIKAVKWLDSEDGDGIAGIEDVVKWLYKDPAGPQLLQKKIRDVEAVLQKSESATVDPDGLTSMSKGACIPLKRVLARIREL